uniref:Peptidase S1 domain-containing protein n=1 Tax=Amphilophus citrinellus TaxID=61819 RepID=A0A3Q0R813_AMPCI
MFWLITELAVYLSSLLLSACGTALKNNRILGGQDATSGSWPWYAVLYNYFGGTLITDQWVLTAASIAPPDVYLGRYNLSGLNPNEVNRTVEKVICHPNYTFWTYENDICLLKLSAPVNFTDYIRPICLASENSTFNNDTSSWLQPTSCPVHGRLLQRY